MIKKFMKAKLIAIVIATGVTIALMSFKKPLRPYPKGCVFRTVMGEESSDNMSIYNTSEVLITSLDRGLSWINKAQNEDGGWGAGTHARQDVYDPHAVSSDPATTSMVAMALLRTGTKPNDARLKTAIEYLLTSVERSS